MTSFLSLFFCQRWDHTERIESMTEKVFFSFICEIINQFIWIGNCYFFDTENQTNGSIVVNVGGFVENG